MARSCVTPQNTHMRCRPRGRLLCPVRLRFRHQPAKGLWCLASLSPSFRLSVYRSWMFNQPSCRPSPHGSRLVARHAATSPTSTAWPLNPSHWPRWASFVPSIGPNLERNHASRRSAFDAGAVSQRCRYIRDSGITAYENWRISAVSVFPAFQNWRFVLRVSGVR